MSARRPTEALLGMNRAIVHHIVDRLHCSLSDREAFREVIRKCPKWRTYPVPIRRGLALGVLTRHRANRDMWVSVVTGTIGR